MKKENSTIKVALIQQSKTADIAANRRRLEEEIRKAAAGGAALIVNQELHDSLYFCQNEDVDTFDLACDLTEGSGATELYSRLARELGVVIVTSMFERRAAGLYHNTAIVFDSDGSEAGRYRKTHIPDDPGFYEKFYFTPGDMGIKPVRTSLGLLGVLVCWDQWYPEAARLMALRGADMLIYPTAIGWNPDDTPDEKMRQRDAWITIQRSHAVANGIPVISVNRCGFEEDPTSQTSGIDFWGSTFIAGPQGEILLEAPDNASFEGVCNVDMNRTEDVRHWWPFLRDRRIDHYTDLTRRFID